VILVLFGFFQFVVILAVSLLYMSFILLRNVPSIFTLFRGYSFYHGGLLHLSKAFSAFIAMLI
jgi:hypothetical protein